MPITQSRWFGWQEAASLAVIFSAMAFQQAAAQMDEIIITAQKREQSIQSVPISVSAFDSVALERFQIENFSDLQFNAPNLNFSKTNFTGNNLQIRGIGRLVISASSEDGVGTHFNEIPLIVNRIFETEHFDLERIEVLRGPQGTLFGRTATGGTVNVYTKKPTDELEAFGKAQYGNFDQMKFEAGANFPLGDKAAFRAAGLYIKRDGFTENLYTGRTIDGRDMFSLRGSMQIRPTESTTIDLVLNYFEENSNRQRITKQKCVRDPSGLLGCLPTGLAFETTNAASTAGTMLASTAVLGPLGLFPLGGGNDAPNPADLRQTFIDFEPRHDADELIFTGQWAEENIFDSDISFTLQGGYQQTSVVSETDYNHSVGDDLTVPAGLAAALPTTFANYFADGTFPLSSVDLERLSGVVGFQIDRFTTKGEAFDHSRFENNQWSIEGRVASDYESWFNFLAGASYLQWEGNADYFVNATTLDYFSLIVAGVDGFGLAPPFFDNQTALTKLDSWALFGEVYVEPIPDVRVTGGLRYTTDTKRTKDRQFFINTLLPQSPDTDANQALISGAIDVNTGLPYDADANTPGAQAFREGRLKFDDFTGRVVIDWTPDVPFTEDTLLYASFSRGFKSGGFNPNIDLNLFPDTPAQFDPEIIWAYEVGTKNTIQIPNAGVLTANLSGFYYDYEGLQISKIINRTSVNTNVDATIWGAEGEFFAALTDAFGLNFSFGYVNTELGDVQDVDVGNPLGNFSTEREGFTLIKDVPSAANCVIVHNGLPDPAVANLNSCQALEASLVPLGYDVISGVEQDLTGNELPAPDFSFSIGGQYTHAFENAWTLTGRVDYYYQTAFFSRIFNTPKDRIESWDQINMQMTLAPDDERWYVRGFVQNLQDNDNITGHYLTDPSSGLFTNLFVLDPRVWGFQVGAKL